MSTIWNNDTIRELERNSIRAFVEQHREYLTGRVLDFGAGLPGTCREPQPYRDLVSGEYVPVDVGDEVEFPANSFDVVLCTQVVQYLEIPEESMHLWNFLLRPNGLLVMTYPTCWDEVESNDLWRFTRAGMARLLKVAGFEVLTHSRRASINLNGFHFPLGYGVVARA